MTHPLLKKTYTDKTEQIIREELERRQKQSRKSIIGTMMIFILFVLTELIAFIGGYYFGKL